jgi:hypothetical protein
MNTIPELLAKLRRFEAQITNPVEFYARQIPVWRELARTLTEQTVRNLIPPNAQPSIWNAKASQLASRVVGYPIEGPGGTIAISPETERPNPNIQSVGIRDIHQWVEAGLEGKPGGKDLIAAEMKRPGINKNKSTPQIAWRVFQVIRHQGDNWERLRMHILEFMQSDDKSDATNLMRAIMEVWIKTIIPVAQEDWKRWLLEKKRELES